MALEHDGADFSWDGEFGDLDGVTDVDLALGLLEGGASGVLVTVEAFEDSIGAFLFFVVAHDLGNEKEGIGQFGLDTARDVLGDLLVLGFDFDDAEHDDTDQSDRHQHFEDRKCAPHQKNVPIESS